jgi:hypothetical protein
VNSSTSVPLVDLGAQQDEVADEVEIGMKNVLTQTSFIGSAPAEFEQAPAGFLGSRHCIGVANGTDALPWSMRSDHAPDSNRTSQDLNVCYALAGSKRGAWATVSDAEAAGRYLFHEGRRIRSVLAALEDWEDSNVRPAAARKPSIQSRLAP